jgi:hypothetical protein
MPDERKYHDVVRVAPAQATVRRTSNRSGPNGRQISPGQIQRREEDRFAVGAGTENAVRHQDVKMHVAVENAAEPVHEGDGAEAGVRRGARTALADGRLDRAQEDRQQAADDLWLVTQVPSDPPGHRKHPLLVLHARQDLIDQVGRDLGHAAGRA